MQAIMKNDVELLGTSLKLQKGQVVDLRLHSVIARETSYWARPLDGKWCDGIDHNEEDSIVVAEDDVEIIAENDPRRIFPATGKPDGRPVPVDSVTLLYYCPDCDTEVSQPLSEIVQNGTAVCPECEGDMQLQEYCWVK
jgi:hypothetical protein